MFYYCRLSVPFALFLGASSPSLSAAAFQEGDACGVTSKEFLNYDFGGDFTVAGEGCTLGNKEGCFCAPDFTDNAALSEWKWQCEGTVNFGPAEGKQCPDSVPIPKEAGISTSDSYVESILGLPVACNTTDHPTGRPGDEVCAYSECETPGGTHSAICGCVDLSERGMEGGMQWFCLHSTCSCSETEDSVAGGDASAESSAFNKAAASFLAAAPLLAAALV